MTVTAAILLAASDATVDGVPVGLTPHTDDTTLIEWQIAQLQAAGVDVIEVVLGAHAGAIIPLVSGNDVEPIVDARWADGEASWLRCGASAVPRDTAAAIVVSIEQAVAADVVAAMLAAHDGSMITRARSGSRLLRLPIVVSGDALAMLRNASGERGLDAIAAAFETSTREVEFPASALRSVMLDVH